jgi:protein ImuA
MRAGVFMAEDSFARTDACPGPRSGGGRPPGVVPARLANLSSVIHSLSSVLRVPSSGPLLPFGIPKLDRILGGGLRRAALHEIRSGESRDAASATGFAVGVLATLTSQEARSGEAATGKHQEARTAGGRTGKILWIVESAAAHEAGFPFAAGLRRFGLSPSRLIVVRVRKPGDALWVFEEGLRCRGLAAVVTEIRGNPRQLDLTASRRLALRAGAHGVMGLLLRQTAHVEPGAAATRWLVAPRPAAVTDDYPEGIGNPAWRLTLERNRSGATGVFDLEWDHELGTFAESPPAGAAHSLPVAALPPDRPPAPADARQDMALDRAS